MCQYESQKKSYGCTCIHLLILQCEFPFYFCNISDRIFFSHSAYLVIGIYSSGKHMSGTGAPLTNTCDSVGFNLDNLRLVFSQSWACASQECMELVPISCSLCDKLLDNLKKAHITNGTLQKQKNSSLPISGLLNKSTFRTSGFRIETKMHNTCVYFLLRFFVQTVIFRFPVTFRGCGGIRCSKLSVTQVFLTYLYVSAPFSQIESAFHTKI